MDSVTYHFQDLDTLIEQVHSLFDTWEGDSDLLDIFSLSTLYQVKIATHEWLANLVQHANFEQDTTDVSLLVKPVDDRIFCVIEDNSDGFVLDEHLEIEPEYLDSLPERGMGLLILKICTEDLLYHGGEMQAINRLEFYVSADQDQWPNTPF
ncbi:MAG TPA: ATP-binding protein [Rhodothermales bacterium]|nr:ATP-binding protein [Rhodothermales bacterium]